MIWLTTKLLHLLKKEILHKQDLVMDYLKLEEVCYYCTAEKILLDEDLSMIFGIFECIFKTSMCIILKENTKEIMSITCYHGDTDLLFII